MARILSALPAALLAASRGASANQYYRGLREVGMGARRAEVLQLFKLARAVWNESGDEIFRDITTTPHGDEILPWPSRRATGLRQNVTLIYRDRTTGTISRTNWSTVTEDGIAREQAMASAIDAYSPHAESYGQDLIGAVHTGSYRYTPLMSSSDDISG